MLSRILLILLRLHSQYTHNCFMDSMIHTEILPHCYAGSRPYLFFSESTRKHIERLKGQLNADTDRTIGQQQVYIYESFRINICSTMFKNIIHIYELLNLCSHSVYRQQNHWCTLQQQHWAELCRTQCNFFR